jgi:adenine deaminase
LITPEVEGEITVKNGLAESNPDQDILKITVVNRYQDAPPALAFIKNFGLKSGAIASSVGHDSHNIIAVGIDDASICRAVNLLIEAKGGVSAVWGDQEEVLPLPVGGIMSPEDGYEVAAAYTRIDQLAKEMGSTLNSPFMTLSFMALLVIPDLKLSDKGLFDGKKFAFTTVFK